MPIFSFSAVMLIGMGAGLAGNATLNSTINVKSVCDKISAAKLQQKTVQDEYDKLFSADNKIIGDFRKYLGALSQKNTLTKQATEEAKKIFSIDKSSKILGLSIFLFILILGLLFKYFNVVGKLWDLIKN